MRLIFTEQAYRRSKALDKIERSSELIKRELFKALVYYESQTLHHWCAEIYEELRKIFDDYLSIKGGKFNFSTLYKVMFDEPFTSNDQERKFRRSIKSVLDIEKPENMTSIPALTLKTDDIILNKLYVSLKDLYKKIIQEGLDEYIPSIEELELMIYDVMDNVLEED